ncbi:MAG: hypothetical protein IPL87_01155 [Candidatus Moraniibacteriota bacterium]|nr:MAG: hypothetical protein IPL87_01155 [Candidatus Moranbacteria bacterium]
MVIVAAVIITAVVVSLWSKYAYTKGNKNTYVAFEALINELNNMAKENGHVDVYSYWVETKGKEYADKAKENLDSTLKFLREG